MKNPLYAFNLILAMLWLSAIAIIHPAHGQGLFLPAQEQPPSLGSESGKTLMTFLRDFDQSKSTRVLVSFQNLSDIGSPQAIVYLLGPNWCGSGGCNTLILAQNDATWKIVSNIRITRPPIRISNERSHGWRDIGVWVQGGGIQPGYPAELAFDGKSYPENPTVPPARRLAEPAGQIVISSLEGSIPLNNER